MTAKNKINNPLENQTADQIPEEFFDEQDSDAVDLDIMKGTSTVKRKIGGRVFFMHPPTLQELDLLATVADAKTNLELVKRLETMFTRRLKDPTIKLDYKSFNNVSLAAWQTFFAELRDKDVTNPN